MADNPFVKQVEFVKSAVWPKDYPEGLLPEIAVAGRSNVGKSSLINKLVNRRRIARVSRTPGRTQLLNFFSVNDQFLLCDLPGYGYAKVPKAIKADWGKMIGTYLETRDELRALLLLVDIRREPGDWEADVISWCSMHGRTVIPVATKIDKVPRSKQKLRLAEVGKVLGFTPGKLIGWSSVTGEGLEKLWKAIQRQIPSPAPTEEA